MFSITNSLHVLWALWAATFVAGGIAVYPLISRLRARLQASQRKSRADGLDIVYDPSKSNATIKAQFEIVAVHGLGAHPDHTWKGKRTDGNDGIHLLRNLLPDAFPSARVLCFSYNSDWLVDAPEKTAQQIGERLLARLRERRDGAQRLPIVFVGHSFGGIIIKEAMCAADPSSEMLADTCGVIFLGTPHQGSSLSTAGALLSRLTGFLGSNTTLLLALRGNHTQLSDLEDRFRHALRNEKISSFHETKPTYYFGLSVGCIVDRESARGFSRNPVGIDTDHSGLNKFSSANDPGFQALKNAIEKFRARPLIEQADDFLCRNSYTADRLKIERLSGDELPIDRCYINLAIVEQGQINKLVRDQRETKDSAPQPSPFSLLARQRIEATDQVNLADIFCQRTRFDGVEISPRRILIRGRAGVGKTTLCKKMVHDFVNNGMWRHLFDRILWVPLRNLKQRKMNGYDVETLLHDEFFSPGEGEQKWSLIFETRKALKDNRTLFVLDGWDEVDRTARGHSGMSSFLQQLLRQPNVIVTSRPSASVPIPDQHPIDLELETIGFNPTQVDEYIEQTQAKTNHIRVDEIKTFLQSHELVKSLVRIPIQLDALCYCWNDLNSDRRNTPETMTMLYQAIQTSLWKKDIEKLEKLHGGEKIQASDLKTAGRRSVERHVKDEANFLEHLSFAGLVADKLEFDSEYRDNINEYATTSGSDLMLDKTLPCLSFLRASDPSTKPIHQSYHFIHLTFQEYFAARCFVRHWNACKPFKGYLFGQQSDGNITPVEFLKAHKYDARYDVMWRFVAGLLNEEKKASCFFEEIEKAPIDLLGPTHQRLVMHCLGEAVDLPREVRAQREEQILQWVLFERDFTESSTFTREPELPDQVLQSALKASGKKPTLLNALSYSQKHLSDMAIAALVELLKDDDSEVRRSAAGALGKQPNLSDITITALTEQFRDEDSEIRMSAAEALGNQSALSEIAMATLVELLKDEVWLVRHSAVEALGKQSTLSDTTIAALVELLKSENSWTRSSAAEAFCKQSTMSDTTIAALIELFKDEEWEVRTAASEAIGMQSTLSDTTIATLLELLKDEQYWVRHSAAEALGMQPALSDTTMVALVELCKDEDWSVQISAAEALDKRPNLSDTAIAALVELCKAEVWLVRHVAAKALYKQSTLSDTTITALVDLCKDEHSKVRMSAAEALGNQSVLSEASMTALVDLLEDDDSNVRRSAAEALGNQSVLSEASMTALTKLFEDDDGEVQRSAAESLGKQSALPDMTMAALINLFESEHSEVRRSAAEVLGKQSKLLDITMTALVDLCKDEHSKVRMSAAGALGKQPKLSDTTIAALVDLFEDEDSKVRRSAAEALGNQSVLSEASMTALTELFEDDDSKVRRFAAEALGKQSALPDITMVALVELLRDKSWEVRRSAVDALCKQSTISPTTMAALVELSKAEDSHVRRCVSEGLGMQLELLDKILDGLGIIVQPEPCTGSELCIQDVEPFYESLLRRSFSERLSLYADGDVCIVNQASGLRMARLKDQKELQEVIGKARSKLDLTYPSGFVIVENCEMGVVRGTE